MSLLIGYEGYNQHYQQCFRLDIPQVSSRCRSRVNGTIWVSWTGRNSCPAFRLLSTCVYTQEYASPPRALVLERSTTPPSISHPVCVTGVLATCFLWFSCSCFRYWSSYFVSFSAVYCLLLDPRALCARWQFVKRASRFSLFVRPWYPIIQPLADD